MVNFKYIFMGGMLYDIDLLGRGRSELRLSVSNRCHLAGSSRHVRRAIANEISTQTIGRFFVSRKKTCSVCTAYVPPLITKAPQGETALNYRFLLVKLLFFNTLFPLY